MFDFSQQVAFVTGGAQGIGKGIALELAKAGADIIVADINKEKAETVAADIKGLGRIAIALYLDVTNTESVKCAIQDALGQFLRIDILVNNAGIMTESPDNPADDQRYDVCLDVNLKGVWRMATEIAPHFKSLKSGKIINIASINGRTPNPATPIYSAAKAGVISLTQSLAANLGEDNINVNAICPGGIITAMADAYSDNKDAVQQQIIDTRILKRRLEPSDIGAAVAFFASEQSRNITGQTLNVDGGAVMS